MSKLSTTTGTKLDQVKEEAPVHTEVFKKETSKSHEEEVHHDTTLSCTK